MGKIYDTIDEHLVAWIGRQSMFFVASAPAGADGHINLSPKGPIQTLRILDERTVAYLDLVGSGAETIAHVRENGRIVLMFCAFEGPPRIVRLHGRGEYVLAGDPRYDELIAERELSADVPDEARRAVVIVSLTRVSDSCGYGVPLMSFAGTRPHTRAWAEKRLRTGGPDALIAYQQEKNARSIDGLPAVEPLDGSVLSSS